jgi:hypothetical protein
MELDNLRVERDLIVELEDVPGVRLHLDPEVELRPGLALADAGPPMVQQHGLPLPPLRRRRELHPEHAHQPLPPGDAAARAEAGQVHGDLEVRPRGTEAPRRRQRLEVGLVEGEDRRVGEGVEVELRRVDQRNLSRLHREAAEPDLAVAEPGRRLASISTGGELETELADRESHERLGIHGAASLETSSRHCCCC